MKFSVLNGLTKLFTKYDNTVGIIFSLILDPINLDLDVAVSTRTAKILCP